MTLGTTLLPQTVTVVRYVEAAENEYGNPDFVEEAATEVKARLEQIATRETTLDRDTVLDRWRAILPAGTDIGPGDDIVEGDRLFKVEGTPEIVYGASAAHHVEVLLTYRADVPFGASASYPSASTYPSAITYPGG